MGQKVEYWCDGCGKRVEHKPDLKTFPGPVAPIDLCLACCQKLVASAVLCGGWGGVPAHPLRPFCQKCRGKGYTIELGQSGPYDRPDRVKVDCQECKL